MGGREGRPAAGGRRAPHPLFPDLYLLRPKAGMLRAVRTGGPLEQEWPCSPLLQSTTLQSPGTAGVGTRSAGEGCAPSRGCIVPSRLGRLTPPSPHPRFLTCWEILLPVQPFVWQMVSRMTYTPSPWPQLDLPVFF